jgi:hypothetical protein
MNRWVKPPGHGRSRIRRVKNFPLRLTTSTFPDAKLDRKETEMFFQNKDVVIYKVGEHIEDLHPTRHRWGVYMRSIIRYALAIWYVMVFLLGAVGTSARPPGAPPIPILIGTTILN